MLECAAAVAYSQLRCSYNTTTNHWCNSTHFCQKLVMDTTAFVGPRCIDTNNYMLCSWRKLGLPAQAERCFRMVGLSPELTRSTKGVFRPMTLWMTSQDGLLWSWSDKKSSLYFPFRQPLHKWKKGKLVNLVEQSVVKNRNQCESLRNNLFGKERENYPFLRECLKVRITELEQLKQFLLKHETRGDTHRSLSLCIPSHS